MERCPVIDLILSYLPLPEIWNNRRISKKIKEIINGTLFIVNPNDVVACADKLIAQCRILEATELLLPYIARHPATSTPIVIMNRFILLMHSEIWDNPAYTVMRKKIFSLMKKKASREIDYYEKRCGEFADEYHILKNIMKKMKITGKVANQIHVDENKLIGELGEVSFDSSAAPTVKHDLAVSGEAVSLFGYMCYKDRKYSTGFKIVNLAIKMNSNNYLAYWVMGVYQHYYLKNTENGKKAYSKSFTLRPDFAYPYYSLGVLASDTEQNDKAAALYQQCMELDPNHVYAHMNYCVCVGNTATHKELIERYQHINEFHPTEMYCYRAISREYLQNIPQNPDPENHIDSAEESLKKAIMIDPNGANGGLWLDLGFLNLRYRQDISEARKCFEEFSKRTTDDILRIRVNQLVQQLIPPEYEESDEEEDEVEDQVEEDSDE
jgi:tetratricopeptide (TPR) repeat protein